MLSSQTADITGDHQHAEGAQTSRKDRPAMQPRPTARTGDDRPRLRRRREVADKGISAMVSPTNLNTSITLTRVGAAAPDVRMARLAAKAIPTEPRSTKAGRGATSMAALAVRVRSAAQMSARNQDRAPHARRPYRVACSLVVLPANQHRCRRGFRRKVACISGIDRL